MPSCASSHVGTFFDFTEKTKELSSWSLSVLVKHLFRYFIKRNSLKSRFKIA